MVDANDPVHAAKQGVNAIIGISLSDENSFDSALTDQSCGQEGSLQPAAAIVRNQGVDCDYSGEGQEPDDSYAAPRAGPARSRLFLDDSSLALQLVFLLLHDQR